MKLCSFAGSRLLSYRAKRTYPMDSILFGCTSWTAWAEEDRFYSCLVSPRLWWERLLRQPKRVLQWCRKSVATSSFSLMEPLLKNQINFLFPSIDLQDDWTTWVHDNGGHDMPTMTGGAHISDKQINFVLLSISTALTYELWISQSTKNRHYNDEAFFFLNCWYW